MLEWEEYFEPHILERGRSYARRGAVKYISRHEDTMEKRLSIRQEQRCMIRTSDFDAVTEGEANTAVSIQNVGL